MNFRKSSKGGGGGGIFNPKIYVADFGGIGLFQPENEKKGSFYGMFSTNYHDELLYYMHLMGNRII